MSHIYSLERGGDRRCPSPEAAVIDGNDEEAVELSARDDSRSPHPSHV